MSNLATGDDLLQRHAMIVNKVCPVIKTFLNANESFPSVISAARRWFLNQDMLTCPQTFHRQAVVRGYRCGDNHGLDLRIEHILIIAACGKIRVSALNVVKPLLAQVAYHSEISFRSFIEIANYIRPPITTADNSNSNGYHGKTSFTPYKGVD
jgi:hypothetical protein